VTVRTEKPGGGAEGIRTPDLLYAKETTTSRRISKDLGEPALGLEPMPVIGAIGRGFEVIIHADILTKDLATVAAFEERVSAMDEIAELRRMFGLPDYFIRVQTADLESYEVWLTTRLLGDPAIARVDSRLTMKLVKDRIDDERAACSGRPSGTGVPAGTAPH